MGRFAIIIGAIVVIFFVFVILYVGSFYHGSNPDQLPAGTLKGNISIVGSSGLQIVNGSSALILSITNTDGWKYASPIFLVPEGDHYSCTMSVFPGHFLITLDNTSYTSSDLPKKVTIESYKETVVNITLMPVPGQ